MNYISYIFTIFFVMLCNDNQACASQNSWLKNIYISSSFFNSCLKSIPSFLQNIGNQRYALSKENQTNAIIAGSLLVSSYCLYLWRQNSVLKTENRNLSQNITKEKKLRKKYDEAIIKFINNHEDKKKIKSSLAQNMQQRSDSDKETQTENFDTPKLLYNEKTNSKDQTSSILNDTKRLTDFKYYLTRHNNKKNE